MQKMKHLIILASVLVFNLSSNAQSVEWTNDLVDIMYGGYDNVLPLKFVDVDANKVKLDVTGGSVSQNSNGHYIWNSTNSVGKKETLTIKTDGKVIGEFSLKFVRFPDPTITLLPNANTSVKNFRGIRGLFNGVKVNVPITVQSYEIQISIGDDVSVLKNKGGVLLEENRKQLRYIPAKAEVLITKVYARCPGDKAARRLGNIQLQ